MLGQGRFVAQANSHWRQGAGFGGDTVGGQLFQQRLTVHFQGIDAQIERRRLIQRFRQDQRFFGAELGFETLVEPVRQITADSRRHVFFAHGLDPGQPFLFAGLEDRRQFALAPATRHGQRSQQAVTVGHLAATARLQAAPPAQHGEYGFGDKCAIGMAELAMFAEIT